MKRLLLASLLLLCVSASADTYNVTCALPKDNLIWPLPKPDSEVKVQAVCESTKKIAEFIRGESKLELWFAVYKVISVDKGEYESKVISFIYYDSWPTSKFIKVKRLPRPFFKESKAVFWLNKRKRHFKKMEGDGVPDLWDIQTYEILTNRFHMKPQK